MLLFALARRGAILVPLNWRLTAAEHSTILGDCKPKWIFSDAEFDASARALGVPAGKAGTKINSQSGGRYGDDILIVYTSGTTGKPKGAVLDRKSVV